MKDENTNIIREKLNKRFDKLKIKKTVSNFLEFFEMVEYEDRQSKYIMTGQRTYDFLGYAWRLPLWDKIYMDFWENVQVKYKQKQILYKETLIEQNWSNLWKGLEINPQPDSLYSYRLKLLRLFFKVCFLPIGKEFWHAFEKKYLDYFISDLCSYAPFNYLDLAKDTRVFSGPTSWYIELYLKEKKMNWKGINIKI